MKIQKTKRGFEIINLPKYASEFYIEERLVQQSSAIAPGGVGKPGSSFLWVGEHHHLSKKQVRQFVKYLNNWLTYGSFKVPKIRPQKWLKKTF